jgi:hypothetical protein
MCVHQLRYVRASSGCVTTDQQASSVTTGITLVAVNPHTRLSIYDEDSMRTFAESKVDDCVGSRPPHIFAVAQSAMTSLLLKGESQSIIINGESGAGKTETAKYAMRYCAFINGWRLGPAFASASAQVHARCPHRTVPHSLPSHLRPWTDK